VIHSKCTLDTVYNIGLG